VGNIKGVHIILHVSLHVGTTSDVFRMRYNENQLHELFGTGVLHLIQINHKPDATIFYFIILTFVYSSTFFGYFPAHHQELNDCSGSLWLYLLIVVIVVLCLWSGRPANKLKSCCIKLVIYLNCTMMHGLTNLKFYI
jgi:glucan phosphoethanolaminetransferase (alkaline phosphatase superfamily)